MFMFTGTYLLAYYVVIHTYEYAMNYNRERYIKGTTTYYYVRIKPLQAVHRKKKRNRYR